MGRQSNTTVDDNSGRHRAAALLADAVQADHAEAAARGRKLAAVWELFAHTLTVARQRNQDLAERGVSGPLRDAEVQNQVFEDIVSEVEVALLISRGVARGLVEDAVVLGEHLPEVLFALTGGRLPWAKAAVMIKHWSMVSCDPKATIPAIAVESNPDDLDDPSVLGKALVQDLLENADQHSARQLDAYARRRRQELGVVVAERAHRLAQRDRRVWVEPLEDGMAQLCAVLEAQRALAIADRVDAMARHQAKDARSIGERRADVLADLLLDAEIPSDSRLPRGVRGRVSVVVGVEHLLAADSHSSVPGVPEVIPVGSELSDSAPVDLGRKAATYEGNPVGSEQSDRGVTEPTSADSGVVAPRVEHSQTLRGSGAVPVTGCAPRLIGYGPITAHAAVQVAANSSSWRRLLTNPGTAVPAQYGRETYAVPAGLRAMLEIRDETCRFSGCLRPASQSDIDHTVPFDAGGATDANNLAHLCRTHHRIKHRVGTYGRWIVEADHQNPPTGRLKFQSPLGTVRVTESSLPPPF
ncbi:HNH endonuclease signature motif containing protein [Kocuria sp.]|uniref:HNH endonuclease signature motif containing protein n=1 Tax=Kocuria sp. TaxID=1871328 RepID=UPI0026DEE77F|nr:HNH endonuclease signature motif containing protein [Kocuria sp.]MDO5619054.1 DUF222 domain-containing protein [Kocuria sp.]